MDRISNLNLNNNLLVVKYFCEFTNFIISIDFKSNQPVIVS
jgi:hypothetical protein